MFHDFYYVDNKMRKFFSLFGSNNYLAPWTRDHSWEIYDSLNHLPTALVHKLMFTVEITISKLQTTAHPYTRLYACVRLKRLRLYVRDNG